MGKYKIYVYAICKNEEKFVERWMDAVSEADGVVVVDTGSTDNSVQKLRAKGAIVFEEKIVPWRFDTARNMAMSHIPEDADICVSNDIDEVFEPGWREELEKAWDADCTRAKYWFVWEQNISRGTQKRFTMEKTHLRHGFKWVHPVHEVLEYSGEKEEKSVFVDKMVLCHKPDLNKSRNQYLPLLELSSKENPNDDRTKFWLGREYVYKGNFDQGIQTLKEHLEMPSAGWAEERSASMRFIARAYNSKGDAKSAVSWLYRAIAECPDVREPWHDLARMGYHLHDWPLLLFAAEKGLDIKFSTKSYLVESAAWGYLLEDYAAIACYWLGFYERALSHAKKACEISPDDPRLQNNLELIKAKLERGENRE